MNDYGDADSGWDTSSGDSEWDTLQEDMQYTGIEINDSPDSDFTDVAGSLEDGDLDISLEDQDSSDDVIDTYEPLSDEDVSAFQDSYEQSDTLENNTVPSADADALTADVIEQFTDQPHTLDSEEVVEIDSKVPLDIVDAEADSQGPYNITDTTDTEEIFQDDSDAPDHTGTPPEIVTDETEKDIEETTDSEQVELQENGVEDWLGEINPNHDPFDVESPYSNNCGSCALAVHNRINGIEDAVATDQTLSIEEMNAASGMEQVEMTPDEIQEYMLAQGDGADGIVGIDRVEGPGHWFNVKNEGGKVIVIDGQTSEVTDWPPDMGDVKKWDLSVKKETKNNG